MKRRDGFVLRELGSGRYLIPYGQNIAEHARGTLMNDAGVLIWELLSEERTEDQLIQALMAHWEASEEDRSEITADVKAYLATLRELDLIEGPYASVLPGEAPYQHTLSIAGLSVRLCGPDGAFSDDLLAFASDACSDNTPDLTVEAVCRPPEHMPLGELILNTYALSVIRTNDGFALNFREFDRAQEAWISADGKRAIVYLNGDPAKAAPQLFHVLRHLFLFTAQTHGVHGLHSVSVLYRERVWLFSGPSGMGKSTHAALWRDYAGAALVNGDVNLLSLDRLGKPVVHGLPWCGTSGVSTVGSWPLGGIVLLGRSPQDRLVDLSAGDKALQVSQRMISPVWTEDQLDVNLAFAQRIASTVPVYKLYCTKEPSALHLIRNQIDRDLSERN